MSCVVDIFSCSSMCFISDQFDLAIRDSSPFEIFLDMKIGVVRRGVVYDDHVPVRIFLLQHRLDVPGVPEVRCVFEGRCDDAGMKLLFYFVEIVFLLMFGLLFVVELVQLRNVGIVLSSEKLDFKMVKKVLISDAFACLHFSRFSIKLFRIFCQEIIQ